MKYSVWTRNGETEIVRVAGSSVVMSCSEAVNLLEQREQELAAAWKLLQSWHSLAVCTPPSRKLMRETDQFLSENKGLLS